MKKVIVILIVIAFSACTKAEKKQFSYWKINGQDYSSNNVESSLGKPSATISCHEVNRFDLYFFKSYFPTSGTWLMVRDVNHNTELVSMNFYLGSKVYIISVNENKYLIASLKNNKAQYSLPPTWFTNYNNFNDSVLVEGTFNQP